MELVSRMMDGSIPQPPEAGPGLSDTPARLRQDEKMTYLQRVQLFEACSSRQLRAIARIAEAAGPQSPGSGTTETIGPGGHAGPGNRDTGPGALR